MKVTITPDYLSPAVQEAIANSFKMNELKSTHLYNFLDQKISNKIKLSLKKARAKIDFRADSNSFSTIPKGKEVSDIFQSKDFKIFLEKVSGKKIKKISIEIKSFSHKNFTIMHDGDNIKEDFHFLYILSTNWNSSAGGNRVYLTKSGEGDSFIFPPIDNSLVVVDQDKKTNAFFQYVNHCAGKNRYFVVHGKIY